MKLKVRGHGELEIEGLTPAGLPALRLVAYHSPEMTVNFHTPSGLLRVLLKDIDLNPSFSHVEPVNQDRAQLAKLGGG